jgi:hypothetical protein
MSLTHQIVATPPAAASSPKSVSISGMKVSQTSSAVASGVQNVTTSAAPIDIGTLTGNPLGRFAIKNLDGTNSLTIETTTSSGVAFITLLPGEMAQGRFDSTITAPAVLGSGPLLMEYIICGA